jgi:hypothetical protein
MLSKNFRIIAITVMIAVLPMLSGGESVAYTALADMPDKSCCDGCKHEEDQRSAPAPASTPACPLVLCLSIDVVEPFAPQTLFAEFDSPLVFVPQPHPDLLVRSIFHPPSAA